ncbi:MAG TPA: c-type cytochrome [Acidimicrobiales bacterium]|nr:c-type cytochrome [Acidimicrobiales bacterium]
MSCPGRFAVLAVAAVVSVVVSLMTAFTHVSASQPREPEQAETAEVQVGENVFRAHCAMCHGGDASGMMGMHPSLRGAVERLSREGVEVTIRQGRRTQPPMPAWEGRLSDEEIDDVVAYIASLPTGPRNFGPGSGGPMMMHDNDESGRRGDVVVALPLLVLAVVIVAAVLVAAGWGLRRAKEEPRRVLDRRYAAGELSRQDYLQRRSDLEPDATAHFERE